MAKRVFRAVIRNIEIEFTTQDSIEIDEVTLFKTEGYLAARKAGQEDTIINTYKEIKDNLIYRGGEDR